MTGEFRVGDIRHCFADVALARETLGYEPEVELEDGIAELAQWLEGQIAVDRVDAAAAELAKGLARLRLSSQPGCEATWSQPFATPA